MQPRSKQVQKNNFRFVEKLLYEYKTYDTSIAELQAQLDEMMPAYTSSVLKFSHDLPHRIESQPEKWAIKRVESIRGQYLQGRIAEMKRHKEAIFKAKQCLDETESQLVFLKYELEKPHNQVARSLNMWDYKRHRPTRAYWNMRERTVKKIIRFLGLE